MHFSQIGFTDARTFIAQILSSQHASRSARGLRIEQLHNPSACPVAFCDHHSYLIPRPQAHEVDFRRRAEVRNNSPPVLELDPAFVAREQLNDGPEDFGSAAYGLVNTHGPSAVTATQCSKWAE